MKRDTRALAAELVATLGKELHTRPGLRVSRKCGATQHAVLAALPELEAKLLSKGFPAMSPWWRATFERFYRRGARQLVARVGRRGGKSSSLSRIAVLEALEGEHAIPPGDLGVVAIISVDRREAARRIYTIRSILDAIGEPYAPVDGGIRLTRRPVAFQVFTASIAGVSGFTSIFVLCDEVAKWRDADTGANPAREVLSSVRPTMATQRNAHIVLSSSPLGSLDAHAHAFDEGDSPAQLIAYAPSWEANPTLSEAETHRDEPDLGKWRREYQALPMEGNEESLFSVAMLDRATRASGELAPSDLHTYVAAMDPATRGNGWTLVVGTRGLADKRVIALAREWRGTTDAPLDPDKVLSEIAALLKPYRVTRVLTDQWAGDPLASIGRRHGLKLIVETVSAGSKIAMYEDVSTWLADGSVEIPAHPGLRADLLGVRRRVTTNGMGIVLSHTPDGRHSDYAPPTAMALGAHCPPPRVMHTPEENEAKRERDSVSAAVRKFGGKRGQPWWQKDPLGGAR